MGTVGPAAHSQNLSFMRILNWDMTPLALLSHRRGQGRLWGGGGRAGVLSRIKNAQPQWKSKAWGTLVHHGDSLGGQGGIWGFQSSRSLHPDSPLHLYWGALVLRTVRAVGVRAH